MLNTTPRTWVTGELVTAAEMNAEVRDAITGIQAAWTAYTPTWSATTTNPALGNGTLTGAYLQVGKTVLFRITLTMGSTTTYGSGNYIFSLPLAPTANNSGQGHPVGSAYIGNAGTKPGMVNYNQSPVGVYVIRISTETLISSAGAGAAWASGHTVFATGMYETA